jgi:hypothetical protein
MNQPILVENKVESYGVPSALSELQAAQELVARHRRQGFAALNGLFRRGTVPEPWLEGRYAGKLIAIDIAPGLTQLFQALFRVWMPWLGKTFDPARQSGDNIFTQDSYRWRVFQSLCKVLG